jgi:anti-sigma B factor antagonist
VDRTPDPDLHIDVVRDRGAMVVAVRGELDAASTPDLQARLRGELDAGSALVLDLLECEFIDSTGLHAIIDARAEVEDAGGRFAIACADDGPAARVIEVALPGMLETYRTRDAAVAAVTG